MKTKILYIEDEPFLGKIVKETLEGKGYEVTLVDDGAKVMGIMHSCNPNICILDVMLPNVDGFTLGKQIRGLKQELPIIFLTAKSETDDLVEGFESGGTDYIKKPFSMKELIIRIENQLKLSQKKPVELNIESEVKLGEISFFPNLYELHTKKGIIKLSSRESEVLSLLVSNKNACTERKTILISVWGEDSFFNSRTLDVYIRKLRKYLELEPEIEIITLKGKGYHLALRKHK